MTTDANSFLMGAGGRAANFKAHGDQVWGEILRAEVRQQTDFESGALKFWDDGNPMMQLVVTLQTDEQDDGDDDGVRRVFIRGQMQKAVAAAVTKAGERGIREGGRLFVRYTGDGEPARKGMSGAKLYVAKYEAPTVVLPADEPPPYDETPDGIDPDDLPF